MCPVCGDVPAPGQVRCPTCAAPTAGEAVDELRAVNIQLHRLQARRGELVAALTRPPRPPPPATPPQAAGPVRPPGPPEPPGQPIRVQALLAGTGAALLAAAAVVFAAVTWSRLPDLVQLGLLVAGGVLAAWGGRILEARSIRSAAGSLTVLATLVLGVVGWAASDGRLDVGVTLSASTAWLLVPRSTLSSTRVVATLAAGVLPVAWLLPLLPGSGWAQPAGIATVLTLATAAGIATAVVLRAGAATPAAVVAAAAVVALVAVPPALSAGFATAADPAVPGLGLLLLAPYALVARLVVERQRWLAVLPPALAVAGAVVTLVAAGMSEPVAFAVTALPIAALILWAEHDELRLPGVIGVVAVMAARPDLVLEPVLRVVGRLVRVDVAAEAGGLDLDVAVTLAAITVLTAAVLWLARPADWRLDAVRVAVAAALVAAVIGLDAVVAAALVVAAIGAITALRAPAWPATIGVLVVTAWLLPQPGEAATVILWSLLAAVTVLGAWLDDRLEITFAAGVLPPLAVTAVVADGFGASDAWPQLAGLVVVAAAAAIAARTRRVPAEIGVWLVAGWLAVGAVAEGLVATGMAAAVVAVAAAVVAVWGRRRWAWWVSRGGVTTAAWAWLAAAEVTLVEAYTVVPALLLGAVGVRALWRQPTLSSWLALGPALSMALVPTAAVLVADVHQLGRTLGLLTLGVVLALVGGRLRLSAPLVAGAAAALLVALLQLWTVVDLAPRWVALTLGGGLLLWAGVSYERQLVRVRQVRDRLASLR